MTLESLPTEVIEHIAFYHVCPQILGLPVPLTALLLSCKAVYNKLSGARHLYARVFQHKFSSSAIRRRGFEPKAGEWAWQLRWWTEVLGGIRRRRTRLGAQVYRDDPRTKDPDVQETMYVLWIMCLEDDGRNRVQMQLAGAYEWVQGWIRNEMYKAVDKGWPLANASNSCAMWVFWYLTTKARLMEESEDDKESLVGLVLPFLTVPFRYPTAFAPANHFRLPLHSAIPSSSTPLSIPTPHGPFPIYLHPARHTWLTRHFERWTPLCTPLAADAAKLVYFSRRETLLFPVLNFYPRDRQDHRNRVRARLAAEGGGQVDEHEVERVFRSELPNRTQEDFEELNAGLLGGIMVEPSSSSFQRGGGTSLSKAFDVWDDVRKTLPGITGSVSDEDLAAAERILRSQFDESACSSRLWDTDWWRLRLARSAWNISRGDPGKGVFSSQTESRAQEEAEEDTTAKEKLVLDDDMRRSPVMLTGYPQKGPVYTPGALTGLWTGRMLIPSETHLRALLLPPQPPAPEFDAFIPIPNPDDPADPDALGPDPDPGPNNPDPDPNDPNAPLGHLLDLPADVEEQQSVPEAGHRPQTFVEDTLRLVTVPLYLRLAEYVVFSSGKAVPCVNDTHVDYGGEEDGSAPSSSLESTSNTGARIDTRAQTESSHIAGISQEAYYDQGIRDAWLPANTSISTEQGGDRIVVTVPPGADNLRVREETEKFTYVKAGRDNGEEGDGDIRRMGSEAEARSRRQPGTYHGRDTCPGCIAREQALLDARIAANANPQIAGPSKSQANPEADRSTFPASSSDYHLPPYVPSPQTIPLCDGVRDVLLTGTTDPRHAAAWGKWAWKGRVRTWDGLVGLVRSAEVEPSTGGSGGGKIFFYGTLIGGRNLVGTWRLAHEDPRMPAYEGAFTLGRKDEG